MTTNLNYDCTADIAFEQDSANIDRLINSMREKVLDTAIRLPTAFQVERSRLYALAAAEEVKNTDNANATRVIRSTLAPCVRLCYGQLKIEWQIGTYAWEGKPETHTFIRQTNNGYGAPFLVARAKPYEVDLVLRTEREAASLRAQWEGVMWMAKGFRAHEKTAKSAAA